MAISLDSLEHGISTDPPRTLLYAPRGFGKTTWASEAPNPIIVATEKGTGLNDVRRTPLVNSFDEVMAWLRLLYSQEHPYESIVLDTLDGTEELIHDAVRKAHDDGIFADYGKGFTLSLPYFEKLKAGLNALHNKGMNIIILAHSQIKRYEAPNTAAYDRFRIDVHEKASKIFEEWVDCILFGNVKVYTTEEKGSFNKKVVKGVTNDEHIIHTTERPAFVAKNRYDLPLELPFVKGQGWKAYEDAIATARKSASKKEAA